MVDDIMKILDTNLQARYNSAVLDHRSTLMLRRSLSVLNEIIKEFMNMKMTWCACSVRYVCADEQSVLVIG